MLTIRDLLKRKNHEPISVEPRSTVYEALCLMARYDAEVLPVIDNSELQGTFSFRDYAKKVVLGERHEYRTLVSDVMMKNPPFVALDHQIDTCMKYMIEKDVRYLPIMDNETLIGIISLSDISTGMIESHQTTIQLLETYISGGYLT